MDIIPVLYQGISIIAVVGYMPQIHSLLITKGDCQSISILTWGLWLFTWVISFMYGMYYLEDWRFMLLASINIAGHSIIIGLTMYRRRIFAIRIQTQEHEQCTATKG